MTISIIGCGWLGLPLGSYLHKEGLKVRGTTTSEAKAEALQAAGIEPTVVQFLPKPNTEVSFLFEANVVIIALPPRVGMYGSGHYVEQMEHISTLLNGTKTILISSTSVYPENNETLTEASETIPHSPLVLAENILKNSGIPLTVLRCGGLMGYGRIPGKYFVGKTVNTGNIPVNFVHRDDVIGIIEAIITQNLWNETLNVVAPEHPVRREVYEQNAQQFGWQAPIFVEPDKPISFKIISPQKLQNLLQYSFLYPNPLRFF